MKRLLIASGILVAGLVSTATAQEFSPGQRVVVIHDNTTMEVSGKVMATVGDCTVFTVGSTQGNWLWIKSEQAYLRKSDVIPFEDAIEYYTNALEQNRTAWNYWHRAHIWRLKGELDIALGDMNDAIRLNPEISSWYLTRGILHEEKSDLEKAIADYSEAIRLDPKCDEAYHNRGNCWKTKKDYDKALTDYNQSLKLMSPDEKTSVLRITETQGGDSTARENSMAVTYCARAAVYLTRKEYDKAVADYEEAIRLQPDNDNARNKRREVWEAQKAWDKLVADCTTGLSEKAPAAPLLNLRGFALMKKNELDRALADFEAAISLDPAFEAPRTHRRTIWTSRKDFASLNADYAAELQKNPDSTSVLNSYAWFLATVPADELRNGEKAVQYATRACELTEWANANLIDTLAAAYAEAGNYEKAIEYQRKAMELAAPEQKQDFESRLVLFEKHQPYRDEMNVASGS